MAVNYSTNKMILGCMMLLDKFSCKQSDLIVAVGRDLIETLNKRFENKKVPKTVLINNWMNEKEVFPLPQNHEGVMAFREKWKLTDKFVFMYSGNIGLYYDLENIIKIIHHIPADIRTADGKEVVFVFVGSGAVLDKLKVFTK